MSPPKDPEKLKLWKERQSAAAKTRIAREVAERVAVGEVPFPHLLKGAKKHWGDPGSRERHSEIQKISQNTPENKALRKKLLKERWDDPVERAKLVESRKDIHNPISNNKKGVGIKKAWEDPLYRQKNIESRKKTFSDPGWKIWKSQILKKRYEDPELLERMRGITTKRYEDPMEVMKLTERLLGGFWYGNVRYYSIIYCELWKDVNPRVHAFFDYKCCGCGVPENGHSHIGHHVFYVKEACCWHSDDGIYYTNLNALDHKENDYCIGENPNYFVILCQSCHGKTNGKFANRKKWADFYRIMIDEQYGGKCYYTKEEIKKITGGSGASHIGTHLDPTPERHR
jgi:hypothetical protein